jgi:hypothetical protein
LLFVQKKQSSLLENSFKLLPFADTELFGVGFLALPQNLLVAAETLRNYNIK